MTKKIYHLATCNTCQRIIKELDVENHGFEMQNIKAEAITSTQLEEMYALSGSYEALFSRRAMKYRSMKLNEMEEITEEQYRKFILEEYTFLKRPVIIYGNEIFIGSLKKNVEQLKKLLS